MTETERAVPRSVPATMPVGGAVTAIVPQSLEEIQRMANTAIAGGLAPASLVKWPKENDSDEVIKDLGRRNIAAVSGVLMAGAELGVPPMAALRMFTSINGRVALYADGNVAVVRRARDRDGNLICSYIRQGFIRGETDATTFAWCEAKRADNDEIHREEFSVEDAKLAGLWDAAEFKRAKVWRNGVQGWHDDVPNDSVWHRYPKRMMLWRATGYALRWLFADVLAGMVDEFEAREIEGFVDITPSPQLPPSRPTPPTPPAEEDENQDASNESEKINTPAEEGMTLAEADVARQAETTTQSAEVSTEATANDATKAMLGNRDPSIEEREAEARVISHADAASNDTGFDNGRDHPEGEQHVEEGEAPAPTPPAPPPDEPPDPGSDEWFARLEIYLQATQSADDIEALWVEMDVESELSSTSEMTMQRADDLKNHYLAKLGGQGDLLGGGNG